MARDDSGYESLPDQLYTLVADGEPGSLYNFTELERALGQPRRALYQIVRQVNKRLLKGKQRCLLNIPGVGYQVSRAADHLPASNKNVKRATNQFQVALDLVTHIPLRDLTPEQRERVLRTREGRQAFLETVIRIEARQYQMEQVVAAVSTDVNRHASRIDDIERNLQDLVDRVQKRAENP